GVARADAVDEVSVVIAAGFAVRAGLDVVSEPRLVGVVAVDSEKSVGTVENVADCVGFCILGTERCGLLRRANGFFLGGFWRRGGEAGGGEGNWAVRAGGAFGFVVWYS